MKSLKTLLGIALATAGLGGAVSVGVASSISGDNNIRVAEAAGSETIKAYDIVFADESNISHNAIHVWDVTYENGHDADDLLYWFQNYKGPITSGSADNSNTTATFNENDSSFDIVQSKSVTGWYSKKGKQYVYLFPHYVTGFKVIFKHADNWNNQSPTYTLSSKQRCLYGLYNNGANHYGPESADTNHTESFNYYTVTRKYGSTTLGTNKAYAYSYFKVPEDYTAPSGYSFKGWYKDSSFNTPYSSKAVLTQDTTLFAKCEVTTYSVFINGVNAGNLATTATAGEYKITLDVAHGDVITFQKDGAAYATTYENSANNNYDNDGVIFSAEDVDLYLKTGSSQFWLAGMPTTNQSHYLVVNGDLGTILTLNPDNNGEKYAANVRFVANDQISFIYVDNSSSTFSRYSLDLNSAVDSNLFTYTNNKIKCLVTGYYNIFVGVSGSGDKAYIESVTGGAAYTFAVDFNDKIGAICETVGSEGYIASLQEEWGKQSTAFSSLHIIAKDTLKTANADDESASEIEQFAAKYLRIIYLYGTSKFANFAGRTDIATTPVYNSNARLNGSQIGNSTMTVIIVVSSVSIISLAGVFFLLRKKKHN